MFYEKYEPDYDMATLVPYSCYPAFYLTLPCVTSPVPVCSQLNERVFMAGFSRDRRTAVLQCSQTWTLNWRRINCEWQNVIF